MNKIAREPLELGSDIWITDFVYGVDDLIIFWLNSVDKLLNYFLFQFFSL